MIIEIIISGPETLLFLEWTWYLSFWRFSEFFRCIPQIGHSNKLSDGYEIKERTVKIWIMLIMKGQLFFILRQHTDILSWLDIYYHKERSKFTPKKFIDQCRKRCSVAWLHSHWECWFTLRLSEWDRYYCLTRTPAEQSTYQSGIRQH